MSSRATEGFVHLHTHSHYSLLEALPKIPDLVAAAAKDGQRALALTDNGNMYGAIDFYKECREMSLKPIIGVDFHVAPRSRTQKEHRIDDQTSRIILLAKNDTGYRNLIELVSRAHLEGFYYRPRVDRELLEQYREGLVAILPSYGGEHAHAIRHGSAARAEEVIHWHKKNFGEELYIEITRHPEIPDHETRMQDIIARAKNVGVPLVAAHDVYYLLPEDRVACDLVNRIRTGNTLNRDMQAAPRDFSFLPRARMEELFEDLPEALENAGKIAETCNLELTLGNWVFPAFPIPSSSSADAELGNLTEKGFAERGIEKNTDTEQRIAYELGIIKEKGYAPYFLVVADLLRHAREEGILTNTRGSAAGSLVSYLCGITTVNPLEYKLPFERFLNPERPSPPDIDMDLADNRRDELIGYVRTKYGEEHVAQIGTFGTMMARAAVRDVARALGFSYSVGDAIAKLIPFGKQGFPVSIASSLESVPELKKAYDHDAEAREVLDLAQKVEGNARHVGVHAAGVVIAPSKVTDFVPIQRDPKSTAADSGKTITQYDMHAVEDAGLLKFDFLGLTNLSILADSVERVEKRLGKKIDLENVPLDDEKTFEILGRGETLGVFQMAGSGMTSHLTHLEPTSVHDINAMVALYRPGPMAFIPAYIERKKNPELVRYLDPRLEPILKNSYGIVVYQDDILEIAVKLAGYSWGEADKLRKAMGKKIPAEMKAQKEKFTSGCVENGMKKEAVAKLWEQIETFAAYGFGKAHAASYGNLAYKTAYMKANFPVDYMAALLTADAGNVDKIAEAVTECTRMGLTVLPPSINESRGTFTVVSPPTNPVQVRLAHGQHTSEKKQEAPAIRFGLYSIKNFGTGVADSIITARGNKPFTSIADFLGRISDSVRGDASSGAGKNLNKKQLEALIMSGALDAFGERGALLANIEALLEYHREHMNAPVDQGSLFGGPGQGGTAAPQAQLKLADAEPASKDTRLAWEKELLGLYVSGHPLDKHKEKLQRAKTNIKDGKGKFPRGVETVIAGFLEAVQPILTKNGDKMIFGKLADYSDRIEIVAFPRTLKEHENLFLAGNCIMLKGRFSDRNGEASFVVEKAKAL